MIFQGFDSMFKKLIILKDQISIANFDAIDAYGEYDGLVSDLDRLESCMQNLVCLER